MSIYLDLSNYKNNLQLEREKHLAEEAVALTNKQKLSLYKKSQKSGYSTDILEEVYRRGHLIWKPELFEGSREQFAFDRVNSFISGGFASDLDSDLLDESLWQNIHDKRRRIKAGSGERMRKPGEKGAPTKEAIKAAQNEEFELEEAESALAKKAAASGMSVGTLRKVYNRGMAAWRTGHRPGTTPQQWGMARVNSYISKGKGTYHGADKDLREGNLPEVPKDKETGLPKKYTTGKKGTDKARAAHFAKGREKHWDDPSAYEPAPGDKTAKTKESKYTKKARELYGEEYTGAEKVSKNKNDPSSRFWGTKSLADVYKKDTPGEMKESSLLTIKRIIAEKTIKGYVDPKASPNNTKSKLNTLDYDLAKFPFSPFDPEPGMRPYAAYAYGFGVKPASSQQELDWEKANVERQEIRKQKTSLPGTVDVDRSGKSDRQPTKNETIISKTSDKPRKTLALVKEATYKGKTVPLNKPMKGDVKKSKVYVDPDGDGKAQKVNFGDKNMSIKKNQPGRKASYCARSGGQGNLNDKTSANYWSRKAWDC